MLPSSHNIVGSKHTEAFTSSCRSSLPDGRERYRVSLLPAQPTAESGMNENAATYRHFGSRIESKQKKVLFQKTKI